MWPFTQGDRMGHSLSREGNCVNELAVRMRFRKEVMLRFGAEPVEAISRETIATLGVTANTVCSATQNYSWRQEWGA